MILLLTKKNRMIPTIICKLTGEGMNEILAALRSMEYPGRLIIIGRDKSGNYDVIVYAVTGRSPSSQARKIESTGDTLWIKPTDEKLLNQGNPDLLIYPSIFFNDGVAVSNGKQTKDIQRYISQSKNAVEVLNSSLSEWEYEPDAPVYTPRISGCVFPGENAALSIIKRGDEGKCLRFYFEVPLIPGKAKMISTYTGVNTDPLPSFEGEPLDLELEEKNEASTAEGIYDALKPEGNRPDFRVALACVFCDRKKVNMYKIHLINRKERT